MKILVILPRFPYPLEKGDKLRAYHQIRFLSQRHDIYLFALSHCKVGEASLKEMSQYCKEICVAHISPLSGIFHVVRNFFSVRSLQIGYWDSRMAMKKLHLFARRVKPDVVYAQMVRTLKYASRQPYPKVLDFQDALSMNQERRMMRRKGLHYFFLHYEFKMLRSAEFNASGIFDALTIISERDRDAVPLHKGKEIDIVRNGVDFDYFHALDVEKQYDIVFCGNMQYRPNIDAARFLVLEVMPLVWEKLPNARVMLAGATPKASVRQLAGQLVTVTGSVSDIRPCYAQSRVFVAPMRIGSGLQNKLLEAMSMQIPCVTTPLANDALGAIDGEHLLLGKSADQLADCIIRLLLDEELCKTLSRNANDFIYKHFSWEASVQQLEEILQKAVNIHAEVCPDDDEEELEDE